LRERGGRLFLLGVGGSAANCSHASTIFASSPALKPTARADNVAELTARVNDEGWPNVFDAWLRTSQAGPKDAISYSPWAAAMSRQCQPNIVPLWTRERSAA